MLKRTAILKSSAMSVVLFLVSPILGIAQTVPPDWDERTSQHLSGQGADSSVKKLALGDLNKDGLEDIVVARRGANALLLINQAGVLTSQSSLLQGAAGSNNSYDVVIFDANGDGWDDLAFARKTQKPTLFLNRGSNGGNWLGFEASTSISAGVSNNTMIDSADFDGDGDMDLVTLNSGSRSLLFNNGSGGFTNNTANFGLAVLNSLGKIALGDVDNDGDIDIFGVTASETQQHICLNNGSGFFPNSLKFNLNLDNLTYVPVGADFNGDDIFDYRTYADGVSPRAFMSDGTFSGAIPNLIRRNDGLMKGDQGKHGFAHIRDIDGDGDPDYVMSSIEMLGSSLNPDPRNEWNELIMNDDNFSGEFTVIADTEWRSEESYDVLLTDVNADGNMDLFIAHQTRYAVYINAAAPKTVELSGFTNDPSVSNATGTLTVSGQNLTGATFTWDFGDGSTTQTSDPTANHVYAAPGRYQVTVGVVTPTGNDQISFWKVVHAPVTAQKASASTTVVYESVSGGADRVWNVNPDHDSVTVVNASTGAKIKEIGVGDHPMSLALRGQGDLWVVNRDDGTVSKISTSSLTSQGVVATFEKASKPHGIVFDSAGAFAYVAKDATGEVVKVNANNGNVVATTVTGDSSRHLSITGDGTRLFVSRFITPPVPGESTANVSTSGGGLVSVLNPANMNVISTVVLPVENVPDTASSARGLPNYLMAPTVSPDGLSAFVPFNASNIYRGTLRDGQPREHNVLVRGKLGRIGIAANAEVVADRIDFDNNSQPTAVAFGPTGNYLFAVHESSRSIEVLDAYSGAILFQGSAGFSPRGIVASPDGTRIFVHNYLSRSVEAFDASSVYAGGEIQLPTVFETTTIASEVLTQQLLKGKQLFFDSRSSLLAEQDYISCAVCHDEGGHDGRTWDFTDGGEGLRNTTDLRGRSGTGHGRVHWTANFDEIHDFENDIRGIFGGLGLLDDADFAQTSNTLGTPKAGRSADLDALAAFVTSLSTFSQSPYRNNDGSLAADAVAGREIFKTLDCAECHSGTEFTDSPDDLFHDVGTIKASSGKRLGQPLPGIDTPTVRGLWHGAPYLHDGSAPTVADAVLAHTTVANSAAIESLSATEMGQLEAYLLQIDDNEATAPTPDDNGGGNEFTDLLTNGSFENNLDGWDTWNPVSVVNDAQDGTKAARLGTSLLVQAFSIQGDKRYRLNGFSKSSGSPSWMDAQIVFYDNNGAELEAQSVQISDSTGFQEFELEADAPAAATVVSVAFWCGDGGSLILDNLTFGVVDGDDGGGDNGGGDNGENTGNNILTNSGFEAGLNGWGTWQTVTIVSGNVSEGNQAAALSQSLLVQAFSVTPGDEYRLTGKFRTEQSPNWISCGISFYDQNGNELDSPGAVLNASTTFSDFALNGIAPANAASGSVWFWGDTGGKTIFDEIKLTNQSEEEGTDPNAPTATLTTQSTTVTGPFSVQANFSENVTGLTASDFVVTNGTAGGLSSVSASDYFILITPDQPGTVTVSLPAGAAASAENVATKSSNQVAVAFNQPALDPAPPEGLRLTVAKSGTAESATFSTTFANPVVFASVEKAANQPPLVVRISNVDNAGADIVVERLDGVATELTNINVHLVVLEKGTYTFGQHGIKMEVGSVDVGETSSAWNGWDKGGTVVPVQSFTEPIVIGQVQTSNSAKWSQFWSRGNSATTPFQAGDSTLTVGHHTGEDPDTWRESDETIGYAIIEAGQGLFQGKPFTAGKIQTTSSGNVVNSSNAISSNTNIVVSQSGMADSDGSIPAISDITSNSVKVINQEDKLNDDEQAHAAESLNYLIFGN